MLYLSNVISNFICKVTVRCGCQTLKKEWLCHEVQTAYRNAGSDPKDIPKNQFRVGLLPCESNCKSKQKIVASDLHSRRPKVVEVIPLKHTEMFPFAGEQKWVFKQTSNLILTFPSLFYAIYMS